MSGSVEIDFRDVAQVIAVGHTYKEGKLAWIEVTFWLEWNRKKMLKCRVDATKKLLLLEFLDAGNGRRLSESAHPIKAALRFRDVERRHLSSGDEKLPEERPKEAELLFSKLKTGDRIFDLKDVLKSYAVV